MFFVPITIGGRNTIPLDHIVTWLTSSLHPMAVDLFLLALAAYGTARPFVTGSWRKSFTTKLFAAANVVGLIVAVSLVLGFAPKIIAAKGMGPFLWDKIVTPVGFIVPIGAIFLALLVGYGLMEFMGVFMQPIMRPLFKTPGRSAVDAVASFVGSYSLGLLITDRVYREGKYTGKEAAIIATGFSTVSAAFMVIVAKTLGLMDMWLTYFFVTLFVTFAVTAITVHIPPLSRIPDDVYPGVEPQLEQPVTGSRAKAAWGEVHRVLAETPSLGRNIASNLKDGLGMAGAILPSIMSVGLAGLLLAEHTRVFDWLGWIFRPFTIFLPDSALAAKASAVGIAEMFLPATVAAGSGSTVTKFVIGVVAISAIIFFSALVPCIVATEIPVSIGQLVVIWFERVALTILITTPIAYLVT
ncbi:YjiH family protein [Falsarthrobacter nasiphocae]